MMAQSSENVLPTLRDFFNAEKTVHSRRICRDDFPGETEGFTEIPFYQALGSSCKKVPPRSSKPANTVKEKRGFSYQSREKISTASGGSFGIGLNSKGRQQQLAQPLGTDRNMEPRLQKSYSARVGFPFLSSSTESDRSSSSNASSTNWISRIKKMANPFANLHSRRNPSMPPSGDIKVSGGEMLSRNKISRKYSPVHLHAHLTLEYELGMPVFKFSLDRPDDVYVANAWRDDNNVSQFVYLFHSIGGRRNRYVNEQRSKFSGLESAMIGQMHVSTRICLDSDPEEIPLKPAMTEFVLCDIAHALRSRHEQEKLTRNDSFRQGRGADCSNESNPWPVSDLHPGLEIAAIVIQDQSSSDESFGNVKNYRLSRREVKVIVPTGNHGLPNTENSCPLPILQRWRSGGGCDCSGWDMGCDLFVLESSGNNPNFLELFIQGRKENTAAMTMALVGEGEYEVDFHAKLSSLQAFSVCVAILHRAQVSATMAAFSRCTSLRELIDMEPQEIPPSFIPNLTFSPISRV
ncbi:PREDICTED: uncharacterized protein LOC104818007 isoform X2 [Tarenaya hassleriana]|uniref:uncharacterized protein LOC104818007 isoform X2 n=1 Tax=Tarenaya hassleriana TaxID=28532 RepID=UPI00053C4E59|nr:PREDICTED: uncharacterized protein LOC104818007 isoform X2 [Tarenaya hassleriana]